MGKVEEYRIRIVYSVWTRRKGRATWTVTQKSES